MDFCSNCNNMYYIKLENQDCDKIVYYCRNCGTTDDSLVNVNKCILKENINVSEDKFNIHINQLFNMSFFCQFYTKNYYLKQVLGGFTPRQNDPNNKK